MGHPRGLPRTEGHAAGEEALFDTVEGRLELGIERLTVYAFSTENWKRPVDEVRYLMGFNESILTRRRDEMHERGVRIDLRRAPRLAGAQSPPQTHGRVGRADRQEQDNDVDHRLQLRRAGRDRRRCSRLVESGVPANKIDEKAIRQHLYLPDMPDPDLMIRTSGEYRISNFLLWELAYSELVFTDVLWPDFRREHLFDAVREYQARDRRFGAVDGES